MTKSLIHHHFGSKDALWDEIKRTRFADYYDRQMQLFATANLDREMARASMEAYFRLLRDNPQVLRMMSWMLLEKDHDVRTRSRSCARSRCRADYRAAQDAGVLRSDLPASFIVMAFLGLAHAWFTEHAFVKAGEDEADAYFERPGGSSPTA